MTRAVTLLYRVVLALVALILLVNAIKTAQVFSLYGVDPGTRLWLVGALIGISSAVGVVCIVLMGLGWPWSVWVWAVTVLGIAVTGLLMGLNPEFVTRWDVAFPWIVLVFAAVMKSRFATPWN